jgi:hypothetical protein
MRSNRYDMQTTFSVGSSNAKLVSYFLNKTDQTLKYYI